MSRGDRYFIESGRHEVEDIERLVAELGPLVTVPIAAWVLQCCDSSLRKRIARGTLTVVFIAGSPWVPLREVVRPLGKGRTLAACPTSAVLAN